MKYILEITAPGTVIRPLINGIEVSNPGLKTIERFYFDEISELRVHPGVLIDSEALFMLSSHSIPILIVDYTGLKAYVRSPRTELSKIMIRLKQYEALNNLKGVILAKFFALCSIETRREFLLYLSQNRKSYDLSKSKKLEETANKISIYIEQVRKTMGSLNEIRSGLMSLEANASKLYFLALRNIIPKIYGFSGRQAIRKTKDVINTMINYGNAIIREIILRECIKSDLDPAIGFLHKIINRRFSLVMDIAEEFLIPVSHRATVNLAVRYEINSDDYYIGEDNTIKLSNSGKRKLLQEIYDILEKKHRTKNITVEQAISERIKSITNLLLDHTKKLSRFRIITNWR